MRRRRKRRMMKCGRYQSLYQKFPLVDCYINSKITTKHSCQQYTANPCWTPLTRSWPQEIHCGSMIKWIMTSAAIRHTVWICNKTMTIATTKYTVDLWCNIRKCQMYITPIIAWEERWYQCSLLISQGLQRHRTWYISSHVNKWNWCRTWGKLTE